MDSREFRLENAPIIEAVLDIDCDLPPSLDILTLEAAARDRFLGDYPICETRYLFQHEFETKPSGASRTSTHQAVQGFMFRQEDGKQIVQVRAEGFSFNRLAPYSTFSNYLPAIAYAWKAFAEIASPVTVRTIRLRYINRILLPLNNHEVELEDYLSLAPKLPDPESMTFVGFLNQSIAVEKRTGNEVNTTLTTQPVEDGRLPILFDIIVASNQSVAPTDWPEIESCIIALRNLKNRVFKDTLTDKCLTLFQ